MNKIILTLVCVGAIGLGAQPAAAQMMISRTLTTDNTQTAEEEAAGKNLWQQLQTEAVVCANLTDDDFDSLGEYFMGLMMGNSHAAMNLMMRQMMGDDGETQMHVVMGKRFTSCDPSAVVPATATGFTPMMQMMWG
ncbi:MAG: hypothetical protein HY565_06125, partial [Candidatus Kerfeldbacteria bacterium]|nr:hypothetical protein [Candidatus Kerfeldbacteria bacterium]